MAGPTTPGLADLRAYRWAPFVEKIGIEGADLSGATLRMQIRSYRDAPGAPLVDLMNAATNAQGLSVAVSVVGAVPTSLIQIRINETTIEQLLPFPASGLEPGADVELVWDMLISGAGFTKARWFEGAFTIVPGATQA
jgi:hypothetical protein